ncbi:polysaccharide biosynthesis C-terminal domain-containing protein [Halobium palmae]|uniref:Polysaccharide biosynthesis C-terminal domain-containing protein n=1 Tax=Halobium palmae TaxID=1776492 RepID=A0ABD5RUX0_9EURY
MEYLKDRIEADSGWVREKKAAFGNIIEPIILTPFQYQFGSFQMTSILRGFLSIFSAQVANLLLSIIITPLLVRIIGSNGYGDYAFLLSLVSISFILVNAGIFDGMRKFMTEQRGLPQWTEQVLGFYIQLGLILGGVSALIYGLIAWSNLAGQIFGSKFDTYFILAGGVLLARQAYSISRGGLMGFGKETISEPLAVLQLVCFGVAGISLARGFGVVGVLWGQIISYIVVACIGFTIIIQQVDLHAVLGRGPREFPRQELLAFNGLSVVLVFLLTSLYHVDVLLLRPMVGDSPTGYYKAALTVAEFVWFAPVALQIILMHSTSEMWSEGKTNEITNLTSRITRFNLAITALLVVGIGTLAGEFIPLYYGPEFNAAIQPLILLLPGAMGFALARPILAVGQGKGSLRTLIMATGAAAGMNLLLNLTLIPHYGTTGAAIATSASYGSMIVLHVIAARQIGYDPVSDLRIVRTGIVMGITATVIVPLNGEIGSSILSLIIVPPVGFAVFSLGMILLGAIPREDVSYIVGYFN